jgi:hypothetical protein
MSGIHQVFSGSVSNTFRIINSRLASGKVDFVGIGDSNQLHATISGSSTNYGYDYGWRTALLNAGYPMWASGIFAANYNGGNGISFDYASAGSALGAGFAISGAPANLDKFCNFNTSGYIPCYYAYLAAANSPANYNALFINHGAGIDTTAALNCDYWWGSFATGSGSFQPWCRINGAPYSTVATGSTVSTNDGVGGVMSKATLAVLADSGRAGLDLQFEAAPVGQNVQPPFFSTYARVRTASPTGFAYSTLYGVGGASMRMFAAALQAAYTASLTHFFSILRADQGSGQKTIVITVEGGANDPNDSNMSVGPNPAVSSTAAGFWDNFIALKTVIDGIWTANGWPSNELFYLVNITQPISSPDSSYLTSYRAKMAAQLPAYSNAQYLDPSVGITYAVLTAYNWYYNDGSTFHLSQSGYQNWVSALLSQVK